MAGVGRGLVSTHASLQGIDPVNAERGAWRNAGFIWALLLVNGLTFSGVPSLVPLPSGVVQVATQGALAVAFVWVLLVNRDRLVRPNLCLALFSILVLSSLVTSVRLNTGIASLARDLRFAMFVAVLWLLTPLWGRRDLLLARWHMRCLAVACGTVILGLVISPGGAFLGGRLYNRIWPSPSTQVAHYAAVLTGMVIVAWLSGVLRRVVAVVTATVGFAILLLTHTRTATIGLVVGVIAAMLSLVAVRRRARRSLVVLLVVAALAAVPFAGVVSTWFDRGQSSEELSGLSGRAKVWDQIVDEPRSGLDRWLGSGAVEQVVRGPPDRQLLVGRLPGPGLRRCPDRRGHPRRPARDQPHPATWACVGTARCSSCATAPSRHIRKPASGTRRRTSSISRSRPRCSCRLWQLPYLRTRARAS